MVWFLLCIHTLVASVFDHFLHVVILYGVRHVPEITAVRQSVLDGRIGHILHEFLVLRKHWVEFLHAQLIVVGNVNILDFVELEQLLLLSQYFLEEILIHHFGRRQIHLNYKENDELHSILLTGFLEIFDEITLGAEFPHELLSHHSAFLCASEYLSTDLAHSWNIHHCIFFE
jgi:hypothetical protein